MHHKLAGLARRISSRSSKSSEKRSEKHRSGASTPLDAHPEEQVQALHPVPPDTTKSVHAAASVVHTANVAARLVLNVVTESADAFPPLKSVLGGLSALIKFHDQTVSNKEKISRIIPRVQSLLSSMAVPPKTGDTREIQRRVDLKKKLVKIIAVLDPMSDQGKVARFFYNEEHASAISDIVEDIRDAITDYQTLLQQDIYNISVEAADLALLDRIPHARDAAYNAGNRHKCLRDTRVDVLRRVEDWATAEGDKRIYWLNGVAGFGKTTISQSFAETTFAEGRLGASFFCSRDSVDRSNIKLLFPSISHQLACRYPEFRTHVLPIVRADPNVGHASLLVQLQCLIIEPLRASGLAIVVVIDALDECRDDQTVSTVLSLFSDQVHQIPAVKIFIASRPDSHLRSGFRLPALQRLTEVMLLHEVEKTLVDHDIATFLQHHLSKITVGRSDLDLSTTTFPSEKEIQALTVKCGGLFIFASTALHFISSPDHDPRERLHTIVQTTDTSTYGSQTGIDTLYSQILTQAFSHVHADDTEVFQRFRLVVGCILFLFNPMSTQQLATLLQMDTSQIKRTLRSLHSILVIPESPSEPIHTYHVSFFDYLTDRTRCSDHRFHVAPASLHRDIAVHCLNLMNEKLRSNICELPRYSMNSRIEDLSSRREKFIGPVLEYACKFWTHHLSQVKAQEESAPVVPKMVEFAEHQLPPWVEVLSLTGKLSISIPALRQIQSWVALMRLQDEGTLSTSFYECERLVLEFFDVIQSSALHIYHSMLPFSPTFSLLRNVQGVELSGEVKVITGAALTWEPCLRTIETGSHSVLSMALSPAGDKIAVSYKHGLVETIDTVTGLRLDLFLRGKHTKENVESVQFSPDGALLGCASRFGRITIWDTQTNECLFECSPFATSNEHHHHTFAFSPDSAFVAGTAYTQIEIWDMASGHSVGTLRGHRRMANSVIWSSTGAFIASGSTDGTIKLWDPITKFCTKTLVGHMSSSVMALALSPDSSTMASCAQDGSIIIHDLQCGKIITTLQTGLKTCSITLSPRGDQVAFAAGENVGFWDFSRNLKPTFLTGHLGAVNSVLFSPDGTSIVSGSHDCTIKFWQLGDQETWLSNSKPQAHSIPVRYTRFSPDGSMAVSISTDGMVRVWDSYSGVCVGQFVHQTPDHGFLKMSAISPDNQFVALCGDRGTLQIYQVDRKVWNSLPPLSGHTGRITSVAFSSDSSRIVSASLDSTIRVWDIAKSGCIALLPIEGRWGLSSRVLFDSAGIVVLAEFHMDNVVRRWKVSEPVGTYCNPHHDHPQLEIETLPDEGRPNTDYFPPRIGPYFLYGKWILDQKGTKVFWLPEACRLSNFWNHEACSHWHGQKLVIGAGSGRVIILDFSTRLTY